MNTEVHPAVAALVVLLTVLALAFWTWSSGVAAAIGGPSELKSGPDGHRYVQIQRYLVEHDEEGNYLATHDLDEMGIEVFLGSFEFFSNGDILLRRGPDPRSLVDNIRAFKRETNRHAIAPNDPDSGLFRCDLDTAFCERFGKIDFKATFGVFIDRRTDEVYISDTTRHVLRKYSEYGDELARSVGGFKFPNHVALHDGQLLVADTNHHVVARVEPQTSVFADEVDRRDVVPAAAKAARQTWPSHFARVGDEWWVNNMQQGMDHGGLYVFDDDWQFLRRIDLPRNADPISLLAAGDEVWVSDWNNDVVRRFSTAGEPLSNLESEGLEIILALARQERLTYTILSYAGFPLIVIIFLGLLLRARQRQQRT